MAEERAIQQELKRFKEFADRDKALKAEGEKIKKMIPHIFNSAKGTAIKGSTNAPKLKCGWHWYSTSGLQLLPDERRADQKTGE